MSRVYNFSAGPSMLPEPVLQKAAAEMMDYQGSGQSVMEMSHRSKVFDAIYQETQALWREVMDIPENYKVLFMQGGGSTQFAHELDDKIRQGGLCAVRPVFHQSI